MCGCALFTPKEIKSHHDYNVSIVQPHAIFENVKAEDMIFNKGVKGFFARGTHSPVPEKAEVLLELPNNVPITYIDRHTTNGTIFAHAGRDLFAYRNQGKTTDHISAQLLQWVHDEYKALQEKGAVR